MNDIRTELTQDADTVGLRRRFNQAGEDELEECFVIDGMSSPNARRRSGSYRR